MSLHGPREHEDDDILVLSV